jgi:predicted nucleotidyltransferase
MCASGTLNDTELQKKSRRKNTPRKSFLGHARRLNDLPNEAATARPTAAICCPQPKLRRPTAGGTISSADQRSVIRHSSCGSIRSSLQRTVGGATHLPSVLKGMRRDDVIAKLRETEPALQRFGVTALYLFGSHACDEARSDSDDRTFRFLPLMDAYAAIQKAFGDQVEIDYSTRTGLSPYILEDVEREAIRIF